MDSTAITLRLGDDPLKKQYRSILSFNTASLPDNAVILSVTLKIKRQGISGGSSPEVILKDFILDIRKGTFGTSALQLADWQTPASKTVIPSQHAPVGSWYTFDLTTAKDFINKWATLSGLTQIRLRFRLDDNNDWVANYLSPFSGNYAGTTSRPTLIVMYYLP